MWSSRLTGMFIFFKLNHQFGHLMPILYSKFDVSTHVWVSIITPQINTNNVRTLLSYLSNIFSRMYISSWRKHKSKQNSNCSMVYSLDFIFSLCIHENVDIIDVSWRCRDWDSYASRSPEYRIKYWHQKIGILISISKTITIVFILQKDKPPPS